MTRLLEAAKYIQAFVLKGEEVPPQMSTGIHKLL